MSHSMINKLFESLEELERSIKLAKRSLSISNNNESPLLERINYYEEVLQKQRKLASSMCEHIRAGNWEEVTRHIKLINGLSTLVHDDARELVTKLIGGHKGFIRSGNAFSA